MRHHLRFADGLHGRGRTLSAALLLLGAVARPAAAADIAVATGSSIQEALATALPGDTLIIEAGTYSEALQSVTAASIDAPITLRAAEGARVVIGAGGTAVTLSHPGHVLDGLVLDGSYGPAAVLRIEDAASDTRVTGVEVLQGGRSCVELGAPENVAFEESVIHHCLWWEDGAEDAHGIVAGAAIGLSLSGVEIHTFSGSGLLLDPNRDPAGWDALTVEDSTFWLAPLSTAENGFPAGVVPGKNAIETRVAEDGGRPSVFVARTTAHGFSNGSADVTAAFYWKESVDVTMDRITVYDSAVAMRVRGPDDTRPDSAWLTLTNSLIYDVDVAFRYEDDVDRLALWANTLGSGVDVPFVAVEDEGQGLDVQNLLLLGSTLPIEASTALGNLAVSELAFVDAAAHDYHLAEGSPALDLGLDLPLVTTDFDGEARPQGLGTDIGADERAAEDSGDTDDTDVTEGDDTGLDSAEPEAPGLSAAMRAGEVGGCHCATGGVSGLPLGALLGGLALLRRRRRLP